MATGNASSSSLISGGTALLSASEGSGVSSLNSLTGALSLTSTGGTVTITPSGSTINLEVASGGTPAFSNITSGTNTQAAMLVGTGGSLAVTGSGTIAATSVPASGLTGTTLASGVVTSSLTSVGTLGALAVAGGNIVVSGGATLTGVPTPVGGSDAVNKSYVDNVTAGLSPKNACVMGTTANIVATYNNGTSGVGATLTYVSTGVDAIDGVSPNLNDRILVKNQTTSFQNGIYTWTTLGAIGVAGVLTRATDYDQSTEVTAGSYTIVETGTANAGTLWVETGTGPFTIGTTPIVFTELMVASQNLTLTGAVTGTGSGTITTSLGSFSSANLAAALTDETGTGSAVFAGSPTFTGTITTPSAIITANAAASTPAFSITGAVFSGTATNSVPLDYINNGATPPTSWSTAGTYSGINAASGFTGNFLDFHINGGASIFKVDSNGGAAFSGEIRTAFGGGASTPVVLLNGVLSTGGTGTTNFPQYMAQPSTASAVTTWLTAGTVIGANEASGFTGNFLDFHVNGGASVFSVSSAGVLTGVGTGLTGTASSLTAGTVTTNANLTGPVTSSGNATTLIGSIPFSAGSTTAVGNQTFLLVAKSAFAGTINTLLAAQTTSGTISVAIKINGTNVTGLSAVSVTSTPADTNATAANTFAIGDIITLVTSSSSSDLGFGFNLKYTRT